MVDHIDVKYVNLLSMRLEKFKQKKPYLWNFRCPICGDSKKNRNKTRGFIFQVKGDLVFKCHNCQASYKFSHFLEEVDPIMFKEYKMEKFKTTNKKPVDMRKVKRIVSTTPKFKVDILSSLTPIDSLNNSHPAKEYLSNRKLPTEALYYTEKFKEWVNSIKPESFESTEYDEPRIIIPFIDEKGNVFGFQGRSLSSTGLRYITIMLDDSKPKIFGLNTINPNETVYVVEGPLDSLLLPNSIAMCGADVRLPDGVFSEVVYVFDNEPRNHQITSRILQSISNGDNVVLWPSDLKEKDINDMVLTGTKVLDIVRSHTYSGLSAKLKFETWKK